MRIDELVTIHQEFGDALFDRNVRNPLGAKSSVNQAIYDTLKTNPDRFFYLNNGITMLAEVIDAKSIKPGGQEIFVRGLSVVNGAQTISTASRFKKENREASTEAAKISVTIIKAGNESSFGKAITKARNHQNTVYSTDFAALEDDQERIRRELKARGVVYVYKSQLLDPTSANPPITIAEAAYGLALLDPHPINPWLLKNRRERFQTPGEPEYNRIFISGISGERVANAAILGRVLFRYIREQISAATRGLERDILEKSAYSHNWVLAKQVGSAVNGANLITESSLAGLLSASADRLRESILTRTTLETSRSGVSAWSQYRNQSNLFKMLENLMTEHYVITNTAAITAKKAERPVRRGARGASIPLYSYPKPLFDYLAGQAPQIGNVT